MRRRSLGCLDGQHARLQRERGGLAVTAPALHGGVVVTGSALSHEVAHEVAHERVRRVAASVVEASSSGAVDRLLTRLAVDPDAEELRAALVVAGASAVLREAGR
jgi:hypothetical protein